MNDFSAGTKHVPVNGAGATVPTTAKKSKGMGKLSSTLLLWIIAGLLLLICLGIAGYYYNQYKHSQQQVKQLSNPQTAAQEQTKLLISQVGALTPLPQDESPTVATVSDISKLQGQAFFANAQNGDKVLIYTSAKKAYLYRPSTNKIINIAPVNLGNNQSGTTTNSTSSSSNKSNQSTSSTTTKQP